MGVVKNDCGNLSYVAEKFVHTGTLNL